MLATSSISSVLGMFLDSLSKLISFIWSLPIVSSVPWNYSPVFLCGISSSVCLRCLYHEGMSRRKSSCKPFGHHDCRLKYPESHTDIDLIYPAWLLGDSGSCASEAWQPGRGCYLSWTANQKYLKEALRQDLKIHTRWHSGGPYSVLAGCTMTLLFNTGAGEHLVNLTQMASNREKESQ